MCDGTGSYPGLPQLRNRGVSESRTINASRSFALCFYKLRCFPTPVHKSGRSPKPTCPTILRTRFRPVR